MLRSLQRSARGFCTATPRRNAKAPEAVEVTTREHFVSVRWGDGTQSAYHYHWLRDHVRLAARAGVHGRR